MDDFLGITDLGDTVRRIKENAEVISDTITKGRDLLDEATEQMGQGRELLDQNRRLLGRIPRTLGMVEVMCIVVSVCACVAVIKYLFLWSHRHTQISETYLTVSRFGMKARLVYFARSRMIIDTEHLQCAVEVNILVLSPQHISFSYPTHASMNHLPIGYRRFERLARGGGGRLHKNDYKRACIIGLINPAFLQA